MANSELKLRTGRLSLALEGPSGFGYTIQSSTDLISWRNVTDLTNVPATNVLWNALPVASEHLFYRASSQ